jgi:hypothetical protein
MMPFEPGVWSALREPDMRCFETAACGAYLSATRVVVCMCWACTLQIPETNECLRALLLHHHHVTNQAIASMPSTPRPTGAEGRGSTAPECTHTALLLGTNTNLPLPLLPPPPLLLLLLLLQQDLPTCQDVNITVPGPQPFECPPGMVPNPAAIDTAVSVADCCMVSCCVRVTARSCHVQ